ncbi:GNAT family N-acetyltransferase [Roseibium sp.]|uniref:GNAT family N-acetyltransferase n=1 Tax=Roseibium sp. TaxID=1936156 RepID=UPI003A97B8E9
METVIIRPLERGDRAEWEALWAAYLRFYEQELPTEVTDGLFQRLLGKGHHSALVAEQDGKLLGLVHYLAHDSTWSLRPTCYLEDLYVDENLRDGGVGRKLIEAVYREADSNGWGNVYWHTHHHNARARQLYDRIGRLSEFVRYDRPKAG